MKLSKLLLVGLFLAHSTGFAQETVTETKSEMNILVFVAKCESVTLDPVAGVIVNIPLRAGDTYKINTADFENNSKLTKVDLSKSGKLVTEMELLYPQGKKTLIVTARFQSYDQTESGSAKIKVAYGTLFNMTSSDCERPEDAGHISIKLASFNP